MVRDRSIVHSLNWKLIGDQLISILKVNLALRIINATVPS